MSTEERDKKAYEYAQSCKFGEWELNGYVEFAYRAGYDSRDSELAALKERCEKAELLLKFPQSEKEAQLRAENARLALALITLRNETKGTLVKV